MYILGFDIGGTKCAVLTALWDGENISLQKKEKCATDLSIKPEEMIDKLIKMADGILDKSPDAIGISCGGPLSSEKGIIMSPPNLLGWDNIEIVKQIKEHYGVKTVLQNDANACAVAEWKFGAGKGCKNMAFLTFGTGLGAGLILNNQLYSGSNDNAGEIGHIRIENFGPVGFGKAGSLEGFCSGNGIAQLGYTMALEKVQAGEYPMYFKKGMTMSDVTAKTIADAADAGDETAINVYAKCGSYLGKGLSILIDILNPERIVIGSIYARSENLLADAMNKEINSEALPISSKVCRVVPAALSENIGDYAAVATALL